MVDRVLTGFALCLIVFEQEHCVFAKEEDGEEVAEGHQSHEDVCHTPDEFKRCDSTNHHDASYKYAVSRNKPFLATDKLQVGFAIIIIGDNTGECEEEYRNSHKCASDTSHFRLKGRLSKGNATLAVFIYATHKDDESRASTN